MPKFMPDLTTSPSPPEDSVKRPHSPARNTCLASEVRPPYLKVPSLARSAICWKWLTKAGVLKVSSESVEPRPFSLLPYWRLFQAAKFSSPIQVSQVEV